MKRGYTIETRLYPPGGGAPAVMKYHLFQENPDGSYDWGSTLEHV
jgi:hypothetical protein